MSNQLSDALAGPAPEIARRLLGSHLVREIDGQRLSGMIVETEAYDQTDAASHSYRGKTSRTEIMFGPAGYLYVYFTYGMHYCCNVVSGVVGEGSAVLIRALEPVEGIETMQNNRRGIDTAQLTNGPAKLCQALLIDRTQNGHDLTRAPLQLILSPPLPTSEVVQTTRIGISKAVDAPWRFHLKGNSFVSKT